MKEFPAILYQVLQQIESEGFVCKEIMVDTYVVNFSAAAEEVAATFKTRIIPISAGTPQELAYAERAVRTIAERSRAMLLGAPHLPNSMWGLSDLHSGLVHDVLPQLERGNRSPYQIRHLRRPYVDHLFIKVFGCPCQYLPIEGPEHKRASKTEWGYYVGMQWPMCLVYRKDVKKVISVSRKKITCHEGIYANFDPTTRDYPHPTIIEIDPANEGEQIQDQQVQDVAYEEGIQGVHSVKVLRESRMNEDMNEPLPQPPPDMNVGESSQPENQGENLYNEEHLLDEDSLLEKLKAIREKA
jgi:hypothetical protein